MAAEPIPASLENAGSASVHTCCERKELEDVIYCMIEDFANVTIGPENDGIARTYAARCLHASIAQFTHQSIAQCPVQNVMKNKLLPAIRNRTRSAFAMRSRSSLRAPPRSIR